MARTWYHTNFSRFMYAVNATSYLQNYRHSYTLQRCVITM